VLLISPISLKSNATEFTEYFNPPLSAGPSSKTCPIWASHYQNLTKIPPKNPLQTNKGSQFSQHNVSYLYLPSNNSGLSEHKRLHSRPWHHIWPGNFEGFWKNLKGGFTWKEAENRQYNDMSQDQKILDICRYMTFLCLFSGLQSIRECWGLLGFRQGCD